MTPQQIGYRRVSTVGQKFDRQLSVVELDKVFDDKVSGSTVERPQLKAMLEHIRSGDTVHVWSCDRLARNLVDLLQLVETINNKGVTLRFHKESLIFTGEADAMQQMILGLMGTLAEFERALTNERISEGIAAAKRRGVKFGRKPSLTSGQIAELQEKHAMGETVTRLARDYDVSRQAVYRALK